MTDADIIAEFRAADALLYADRAASSAIALEEQLRALAAGEFGESDYRDDGWLHLIAAAVRSATGWSTRSARPSSAS